MNMIDLTPAGQVQKIGRGLVMGAVVLVALAGMMSLSRCASDPLHLKAKRLDKAEASAVVNGQQAASNAAGAAITDARASNVARINKTAQEGRNAIWRTDDLDAAVGGYLADLERVRRQGCAPVAHARADGQRPDPDAESAAPCADRAEADDKP